MTGALPEAVLNRRLRAVDWRFLLRQEEVPALAPGPPGPGLALVTRPADGGPGSATLAEVRRPTLGRIDRAARQLRPGGELRVLWPVPVPGGPWLLRRALERRGFEDVRVHWAWPAAGATPPQLWLPVAAPGDLAAFLRRRPARSRAAALARRAWAAAARAGILAPLSVLARRPGGPAGGALDAATAATRSWVLLTGGHRSINKVVALPAAGDPPSEPEVVVKFARVPAAETGLEREARVLRTLAAELPDLPGVPRVRAVGRRAGRLAVAETAIHGRPLIDRLRPETFAGLAAGVEAWLAGLVPDRAPAPREAWVADAVEAFDRRFAAVAGRDVLDGVRSRVAGLPQLPRAVEHRDCAPWNVVLTRAGAPALLDWESAELHGLPALDLVYFLANAAFVLEGALESGRTRETYVRLLDPGTPTGAVAAACLGRHAGRFGLDADTVARLRLVCWVVHARSEWQRASMDAGGTAAPAALRRGVFLGLIREELARAR